MTVSITWLENSSVNKVVLNEDITNIYRTVSDLPDSVGGMLVYADYSLGSLDTRIRYKILDENGNWGSVQSVPEFAPYACTTSAICEVRAMKLYSSPVKNEKILIAKFFNGSIFL